MKKLILCLHFICLFHLSYGQTIYVNSEMGSDQNSGTVKEPLKTLEAGVRLINNFTGNTPITLKLYPGLYPLQANLTIEPNINLITNNRLTIEAVILPDDTAWRPEKMPTIISISKPENIGGDYCTCSFNINTNHVTIRGIKFLGNPSLVSKHFPVYRPDDTLTDLIVSQCIFLGDMNAIPIQVAVMVNGHNTEIDHCLFYNCHWAGIFFHAENWNVPIRKSSMHHCIITDCDGGALWTSLVDSDFEFNNNIVNKCNYFWVKNYFNKAEYTISDCVITKVNVYNGEWQANDSVEKGSYNFIEKNIVKEGSIDVVKNVGANSSIDKNFLHPIKGSLGYELHAGIFLEQ